MGEARTRTNSLGKTTAARRVGKAATSSKAIKVASRGGRAVPTEAGKGAPSRAGMLKCPGSLPLPARPTSVASSMRRAVREHGKIVFSTPALGLSGCTTCATSLWRRTGGRLISVWENTRGLITRSKKCCSGCTTTSNWTFSLLNRELQIKNRKVSKL